MKSLLALVLACSACVSARVERSVWTDAATGTPAALALYLEPGNGYFATDEAAQQQLDVAAWDDGTVVWGSELPSGERELRRGRVAPERVAAALRSIAARIERVPELERFHAPPDSGCEFLVARGANEWLEFGSAHELFEANPNLVAIDGGVTTVDGRGRDAMLASASPEYRAFRAAWANARSELEALIPRSGEVCAAGSLRFEACASPAPR